MAWKTKKLASRTFIHDRHLLKLKRSILSIKDKNEDADASVFQMICKMICKTSVRQAIFFVNIFRQGAVKCEGFCPQRAKAALSLVVSNKEHSNHSNWIRVALLLGEISRSTAWKTKKLASRSFIHHRHLLKLKRSVLSIKDKNQDADASVFQMICKMICKTSVRQAIFFVNIFRQGAVKCEGFCPQRANAALSLVVSNKEHSNHSNWIRVALLLGEI